MGGPSQRQSHHYRADELRAEMKLFELTYDPIGVPEVYVEVSPEGGSSSSQ